jgi:hypothetical protein
VAKPPVQKEAVVTGTADGLQLPSHGPQHLWCHSTSHDATDAWTASALREASGAWTLAGTLPALVSTSAASGSDAGQLVLGQRRSAAFVQPRFQDKWTGTPT